MYITEIWKQEGKKVIGERMIPATSSLGHQIYITIYLLQWDDDEAYLIKGEDNYPHAELRMSIFTKEKAKEIFESI